MMFSIVGVRPLFAQTAKSVSFRISNIPKSKEKCYLQQPMASITVWRRLPIVLLQFV